MINRIAKWALGLVLVLILCPVRYHSASTGIDPSWAVSLNQFHVQGVVFGRDVAYTYGPLAWLIAPMPYGNNLEQGVAFQIAIWLALAATVAYLIAKGRAGLPNLVLAALIAPVGARMLREFGYAGADFYLEFLVLFWIACGIQVAPVFFFVACAATVVLAFLKVSTAIGALAAVLAAPVLLALIRHPHAARFAAASFLGVPAAFALAFRIYAGDWASVARYLRSALEFSAGNSAAMSLAGTPGPLYAAVLILAGFAALAAAFWVTGQRSLAALTAATLGPLFLEYKHSFTRQDSHESMLFTFVPLVLTAVLWFWREYKQWPVLAALAVILVPWVSIAGLTAPVWPTTTLTELASFGSLKQRLIAASEAGLAPDRLPAELLARTAGRSVAIYPYETAYAPANPNLQHRPFPIFQAYVAYTAYLDRWNAEFLESDRRPDFILFDFTAIDDRHPLLDCPATLLAMYRNYELDSSHGSHLLLRRRAQPLSPKVRLASIPARFNITGKIRDFLFRTAPMYLTLSGPNGYAMYARVPPAVLESPIPLSIVPLDLGDTADLFAGRPLRESFDTVAFSGPARDSFQQPLTATITGPGATPAQPRIVPQTPLTIERLSLDRLNGQPVGDITSREMLPVVDTTGFLALQGWAVLASRDSTLWLDAGGRMLHTRPSPNPAPAALFPPGTPVKSFEAVVPTSLLGSKPTTLRIIEVPPEGAPARAGERTLTIQIQPR